MRVGRKLGVVDTNPHTNKYSLFFIVITKISIHREAHANCRFKVVQSVPTLAEVYKLGEYSVQRTLMEGICIVTLTGQH